MDDSNECFNPLGAVYLLHVVLGYHDYYFHFNSLAHADTFIKMFRVAFVDSMSDTEYEMHLDVLTEEEYEKRNDKEEGIR